jgi:hypothetical protein
MHRSGRSLARIILWFIDLAESVALGMVETDLKRDESG